MHRKIDGKTYIECVYTYKGKISHQVEESHSRLLNKSKRRRVAEKVTNEGQTQRQVVEDSVRVEGVEEQLRGGNSTARLLKHIST